MSLKWNRNGNWLLTASRDHLLKLFDIRNMKEEMQTFKGHKKEATGKNPIDCQIDRKAGYSVSCTFRNRIAVYVVLLALFVVFMRNIVEEFRFLFCSLRLFDVPCWETIWGGGIIWIQCKLVSLLWLWNKGKTAYSWDEGRCRWRFPMPNSVFAACFSCCLAPNPRESVCQWRFWRSHHVLACWVRFFLYLPIFRIEGFRILLLVFILKNIFGSYDGASKIHVNHWPLASYWQTSPLACWYASQPG